MEITIDLSKCDIHTIQRWIMDAKNVTTDYMKKEESYGELTAEEGRRYCEWRLLCGLLEKTLKAYYAQGLEDAEDRCEDEDGSTPDVGNDPSGSVLPKEEIACFKKIITEVADNGNMNNRNKIPQQEVGDAKIPVRQRILSNEEKKNLTDKEVFMKEFGLYTNFVLDDYWSNVFREIYGYSPSLL